MRPGIAILLSLLALSANAEPTIKNLGVQVRDDSILLDFEVAGAFEPGVEAQVRSGLTTIFTYSFRLYYRHNNWFDSRLASKELMASVTFNPITDDYLVNYHLDGKLSDSKVLRSWGEMRLAMSVFRGVKAFALEAEFPRRKLYVKLRAEMTSDYEFGLIPSSLSTAWVSSKLFKIKSAPNGG